MNFHALFRASAFFTRVIVILFVTVESLSVDLQPSGQNLSALSPSTNESKNNAEKNVSASSTKQEIKSYLLSIRSRISRETYDYLSTDVLSEVDLFRYSIRKTNNSSFGYIIKVIDDVNMVLNSNTLPESYIPYVRALKSILRMQIKLANSKEDILKIQKTCLTNPKDYSSIPSDLLSPPELSGTGLFSYDILSDPNPPLRLLNKVFRIPKKGIIELRTRLENFKQRVENSYKYARQVWWPYTWYGNSLGILFEEDFVFDDLKRDMDYLRLVSTAAKGPIDSGGIENETN